MDKEEELQEADQRRPDQDEAQIPSLATGVSQAIAGEQVETDDSNRSPDDELILELLGEGFSHAQVATHCSVSTKTVQRRLRDPAFAAEVTERRRQRVAATALRLVRLGDDAVGVITDLFDSESDPVRLQAARLALDPGRRYHREDLLEAELADRITSLERTLDERPSSAPGGEA